MKNICSFLLGFTVLFLGFGLLAAEVSPGAFPPPRRNGGAVYSHRLTPNKHFFVPESGNNAAMEPYSAMRGFKTVTRDAERMLSDECFKNAPWMLLPAWAGIYAAKCDLREPGFGRDSMLYMLSQMYLARFDKALASGEKLLETRPGDYGVLALMGLMSAYRKENFRYLETAFEMHPEHTLYLVHRCACQIPFFFQIKDDWDFIDAFFGMLAAKLEHWDHKKLPLWTRMFMRDAFAEKYGKHWDAEQRGRIPPHLLKVGVRFGGPELNTLIGRGGKVVRVKVPTDDRVIVRRLGPGNAGTAAETPRPVFVWDLDSELRWNWLMANWRTPGETCVDIGTDGRNALVLPESIGTPARVRVDSNTSDASLLASLPRSVTALECDLRRVKDWSFLRSLSLKELRIVPFGSNFDLKMLSHMPLKRLVVANMGNTKDWWEPLVNLPLESLAATNAGFLDVSVFARLRVRELSLVNCVFAGDPLSYIAQNPNLEALQIGYSRRYPEDSFFNDRMNWDSLKALPLKRLYVASPVIGMCRDMKNLEELYWLATTDDADCSPLRGKTFRSLTIANLAGAKRQCAEYGVKAAEISVDTELRMEKHRREWMEHKKGSDR